MGGPAKLEDVADLLRQHSVDIRELDVGTCVNSVEHIDALSFCRDYVAANKPLLVRDSISHWPALRKWNDAYLCSALGQSLVTVALTPNGLADALTPVGSASCFALPHEEKMTMSTFLQLLGRGGGELVPYLQYQNNSLLEEAAALAADVDAALPWAQAAFGTPPEATNLWIGDERSVTSWHRDPYENIYCVVAGEKVFELRPPADVWCTRLERHPVGRYTVAEAAQGADPEALRLPESAQLARLRRLKLCLQPVDPPQFVVWPSLPPCNPRLAPSARSSSPAKQVPPPPLRVTVRAGETLYLPAHWWHSVAQRAGPAGRVVAVNFWHEARLDARYASACLAARLAERLGLNEGAE